jgi:hypothetical protein
MPPIAHPYDWRGFVGAKEKTSVGLLVFNPLWWGLFSFLLPNELGGFNILNLGQWMATIPNSSMEE